MGFYAGSNFELQSGVQGADQKKEDRRLGQSLPWDLKQTKAGYIQGVPTPLLWIYACTSTPQLPFKTHQIPSNGDHKAS